jgi:hypothetical protein
LKKKDYNYAITDSPPLSVIQQLGLDVWHRIDEIFLIQGKHTVEILKKFGILNLKPMAITMVTNPKKLSVSSSDSDKIDLTLYKHLIG